MKPSANLTPLGRLAIVLGIAALVILPLVFLKGAEFGGADGQAETAITQIDKTYKPWASPLIEPASGEIESLLFALQAALGAGVIFYYLGYQQGRRRGRGSEAPEVRNAEL
ncbi:energy-coupling factor ABC transporter substrate-binding protein [Deinococcus arboris]|uniref:energy-coupling factor ABC transporter substrate-binding protein n=1 Tax=Deinococcus arboris TaxID=2682977 RepID=UPI0018DDF680